MAIERLAGRTTSRGALRVASLRAGRFPEERDAVIAAGDGVTPAIRLKYFAGRPSAGVPPWIEAAVAGDDERYLRELVAALADLLPPGGRLMVAYGDDETERGLKRRFPPAVTPIGKALLDAGCTWFKDWYFPEGWLEGGFKLQGNKPVSPDAGERNLRDVRTGVEVWLAGGENAADEVAARARDRARAILAGA